MQVALEWALSLGSVEQGAALLQRLGMVVAVLEAAMEAGQWQQALALAQVRSC